MTLVCQSISRSRWAMPSGGAIIQYTYGFKSPVDPGRSPPQLDATFVGREWRNVPPMAIWSYRLPTPRPSTHVNGHHKSMLNGEPVVG